jgi:hypothetical protein
MEKGLGSIPDNLRPIYEARTAHESFRAALKLVSSSPPKEQARLIRDSLFQRGVLSALQGIDQGENLDRRIHASQLIEAFAPELSAEARAVILEESN